MNSRQNSQKKLEELNAAKNNLEVEKAALMDKLKNGLQKVEKEKALKENKVKMSREKEALRKMELDL